MWTLQPRGEFLLLVLSFTCQTQRTASFNVVIVNQGGPETLALCTAKRCCSATATSNDDYNKVSLVTKSDKRTQSRQYRYMWGIDTDPEEITRPPKLNRVEFVSSGEEIASALESADSLIVVSYDSPIDVKKISPVLQYTSEELKSILLLSRQDAGTLGNSDGGNIFGKLMGGGSSQYKQSEEEFRKVVQESRSSPSLSVLRCGTLKGGGPGYSNLGGRLEGCEANPELGLSSILYKNNFDLNNAMNTISHDKYTLSPVIQIGDPNKMPNGFMVAAVKDSTDASPVETNICTAAVVASAMVNLGYMEGQDLEISLGCEKSEDMPTVEEVMDTIKELM